MEDPICLSCEQIAQLKEYAFFFLNSEGVIQTWNPGVEKLLGYSESDWIGQHTSIVFTPRDQSASLCDAEMRTAVEKGFASDIRWHRRKDGSELFANGVLTPVCGAAGELRGFSKIISDETSRKRIEDSLIQVNAALEHFAYTASHDLKEPLRTIGSYAQLLLRREGDHLGAESQEHLTLITKAVSRMSDLIDDLLAYARAGTNDEPKLPIALDEVVETALSQLAAALQETGATVTHDPLPTVTARHNQITRLFLNLIGNAVKYRAADKPPRIHVSASLDTQDYTTISVGDNGLGFDNGYADQIFEPFNRLHGKDFEGSGVGLTICRRIVQEYGGRIWAESKPGEGSTFFFTLPRTAK